MKLVNTIEYFKLNENGELDVFFEGIKKELNAPAKVVKSSLQNTIVNTSANSNIYVEKNQREKLQLIDGGVGVGKTTMMLKETIKTMLAGGVVVYGTHSIEAQVERSEELLNEIQNYINAGVNKLKVAHCEKVAEKVEKLKALLNRVKMVSSKGADKGETVDSMFQNVMGELKLQSNTGACVLVTNVAVRLINFDALSNNNDLLVLDDDITPYLISKPFVDHHIKAIELVKSCFNAELVKNDENGTVLKLNDKSPKFDQIIKMIECQDATNTNTKFNNELKKMANIVEKEVNNDVFLRIVKNKKGLYTIEQLTKLSKNLLDNFKHVYVLSENVKGDTSAVYCWLKEGVKYDYTMLTYDSENRGKKFMYGKDGKPAIKIFSIAGKNKFTIAKATSDQGYYEKVTNFINNLDNVNGVMVSKNSRVPDNAFSGIKSPVDNVSTVTRGRNDLTHNNVILNYGLNKVDNLQASIINSFYGVPVDVLNEQVTISAQVQNIGRGSLRTIQDKETVLIFPDNETARASMIRFAKSYPELQPFMDELLSDINGIIEDDFANVNKKYEDEKTKKRVNYLKSVHGEENVQAFIDQHGVNTAIDYFGKLNIDEKELKKQVTKIAQKAKDYKVKSTVVKQAAEKVGLNEFIEKCENLKGKAIAELVNNINAGGEVVETVSETVLETVSPTIEKTTSTIENFKNKMFKNKNDSNVSHTKAVEFGKVESKMYSNINEDLKNLATKFDNGVKETQFSMPSGVAFSY
ncbi:hypothetical protein [Pseudoalteromonas sp. ECSMB14103]|uniref:hypothetical protein n=1 Tax=Pseudoalteromonas sp. ECSMB14103 TaxID=1580062 RepID=UPI00057AAEC9|nr:hypothetical protein [Pseudoalteromonas sp. ECSMB14103]